MSTIIITVILLSLMLTWFYNILKAYEKPVIRGGHDTNGAKEQIKRI